MPGAAALKGFLPGGLHPLPTSPSWRLKLLTEVPALISAFLVAPSAWTPAHPAPAPPRPRVTVRQRHWGRVVWGP